MKNKVDICDGPIFSGVIRYTIPVILTNILQLLYNAADMVVVGRFCGSTAIAAVGATSSLTSLLVNVFIGLSTGAGVVVAHSIGARDSEGTKKAVHTSIAISFVCGVIVTLLGVFLSESLLGLMGTPADILPLSALYMKVYFGGMMVNIFCFFAGAVINATGQTQKPLIYLSIAGVTNVILNVFFVTVFKMNVEGVALATVIAQCLSAVLTLYVLTTTDGPYRICWKKLCMDWSLLYRIVCVGLPAAIQQMVTSVSNVFVQSYINVFGSDVMAGWSACMKIDQFMMLPMMSVGLASTTFTGQNVGASYIDRAKKGATTAFLLAELVTIVMMIPLLIFAPQMVYLFNQEAAVIRYGTLFLYLLSPFYILCCVNQVYSNVLRGAGDTRTPMIVMLGSFVVFRQIYLFVMSHIFDSIIPIALGYPAGWLVCSVLIYACYRKFRWDKGMRKN